MTFAGISLAVGIADVLDDDLSSDLMSVSEVAFFLLIVCVLLIAFAKLDLVIYRRMSPVDRMLWRRRLGLRAWR